LAYADSSSRLTLHKTDDPADLNDLSVAKKDFVRHIVMTRCVAIDTEFVGSNVRRIAKQAVCLPEKSHTFGFLVINLREF
jgi:hypothetical protein